MWNECLRAECEFGIITIRRRPDEIDELRGRVKAGTRLLKEMEDGRMNLLARGTRPFRVLERVGRLGYPAGVIEFVDDREEPLDPDAAAGRKAACGCATTASATSTGSTECHRAVCETLAFLGHDEADAGQPRPLE